MTEYKTPNVYVEEIPLLPLSVIQSETAVPVFIGYTEKTANDGTDKHKGGGAGNQGNVSAPVRITSMLEYESKFGKMYLEDFKDFMVTNAAQDKAQEYYKEPSYLLYYQLQMFFRNGGSVCYVISLGKYDAGITKKGFEDALEKLEQEDEPTLILLTDAVKLNSDEYYDLCKQALGICSKKQNLFAIFDIIFNIEKPTNTDCIDEFRTGISQENLKYGAAYFPYLKTAIPFPVHELTSGESKENREKARKEIEKILTECKAIIFQGTPYTFKHRTLGKIWEERGEASKANNNGKKKSAGESLFFFKQSKSQRISTYS